MTKKLVKTTAMSMIFALVFCGGCDKLGPKQEASSLNDRQPAPTPGAQSPSSAGPRFVFPTQSTPFLASSVALDTGTGRLCKTYSWPDTRSLPTGLPLCSDLIGPSFASATEPTDNPGADP